MRYILVSLSFMLLAACATPYEAGIFGRGVSETQLSPNTFQVRFSGNQYTSNERAEDFVLLRSADLTLRNGFKYFTVVDGFNKTNVENITTPLTAHTNTSGTFSGSSYNGNSRTYYTGGDTYSVARPATMRLITCFNDKPTNQNFFDAAFIRTSIRAKYDLDKNPLN